VTFPIYILLGIIPSLIWLSFYLRKDSHPESNQMILRIFFLGMLATIPAALIELGIFSFVSEIFGASLFSSLFYLFFGIALTEEVIKYSVVRWRIFRSPEFDEPLDLMLYMIIAALGFAALENIFYVIQFNILEALWISALRFVGAVFLHTLASGTLGYFLALSLINPKGRVKNVVVGFTVAILLHGVFNYFILKMGENLIFVIPIIVMLGALAFFVSYGFRKLKQMKSICIIK